MKKGSSTKDGIPSNPSSLPTTFNEPTSTQSLTKKKKKGGLKKRLKKYFKRIKNFISNVKRDLNKKIK